MKVDNNIPLPEQKSGRERKYPWWDLKVGDSFLMFTDPSRSNCHKAAAMSATFSKRVKGGKWKFSVRTTDKGIRVWRIK